MRWPIKPYVLPKIYDWHNWFAWYSVIVTDITNTSQKVWLERIERRMNSKRGLWEYRNLS